MANPSEDQRFPRRNGEEDGSCESIANQKAEEGRYVAWRDCIEDRIELQSQLPLGAVQAPKHGWLVIEGTRGHYAYCDTLSIFHLDTGSMYQVESCAGFLWAGVPMPGVEYHERDGELSIRTTMGHVSISNLREALWMMLLLDEVQTDVRSGWLERELPDGMTPSIPPDAEHEHRAVMSRSRASYQADLRWSYHPGNSPPIEGRLTWPHDFQTHRDHAVKLLQIAEGGVLPGCATATPPELTLDTEDGVVSILDPELEGLRPEERELRSLLAGIRSKTCRRSKSR